jgi:outer membrane protein TolC
VIQYERLALSIGVLTQVNLAWIDYQNSRLEFDLIRQLAEVNHNLVEAVNLRVSVGELNAYDVLVEYKYDAILSKVEALKAYGDMRTAIEQINTSIGIPFYLNDPICIEDTTPYAIDCDEHLY